jgi:hypothetical protein
MWIDVIQQRRSFDISSQQKTRPPLMMIKNEIFWVSSALDRKRLQLLKKSRIHAFGFKLETCEVPDTLFCVSVEGQDAATTTVGIYGVFRSVSDTYSCFDY